MRNKKPYIILEATPFGFGPVGKIISIMDSLPEGEIDIYFLATGTSLELAKESGVRNLVECDTEDIDSLSRQKKLISESSLFISAMNPISLQFANDLGTKTVCIDSLFWMWDVVPFSFANSSYYFIQNFPGVPERLQSENISAACEIVGPIVSKLDDCETSHSLNYPIIINLGGLRSPFNREQHTPPYIKIATEIIRSILKVFPKQQILIVGGKSYAIERLAEKSDNAQFRLIGHKAFQKHLRNATALVTSPGLTTSLEAFHFQIPTLFLPPQNYSQFFILKTFQELNITSLKTHWINYGTQFECQARLPEDEGIAHVSNVVESFLRKKGDLNAITEELIQLLLNSTDLIKEGEAQNQFFQNLGHLGTETIANKIVSILE